MVLNFFGEPAVGLDVVLVGLLPFERLIVEVGVFDPTIFDASLNLFPPRMSEP